MARIEWVHRRLQNWALWHERGEGGGLGYAACSIFTSDAATRGQVLEARIPVDELEASVTHDAVESLKLGHGHLHQTLKLFYLRNLGVVQTARTMRRAESTIHAQLGQADVLLAAWFSERADRRRVQWRATPAAHALPTASQARAQQRVRGKGGRLEAAGEVEQGEVEQAGPADAAPPARRRRAVLTLRRVP